jgi:hypothetical protein
MKHYKYKEDRNTYKNPYYPKKSHYTSQSKLLMSLLGYDPQHLDDNCAGQEEQNQQKEEDFDEDEPVPNMTAPQIYPFSNDEEEKECYQEEEEKNSHPKGFFEEEIENEFNIFSAFQNPKQEFNLFAPSSEYFKEPSMKFDFIEEPAQDYDEDEMFIRFDNLEELREESEHYNYDIANKDISTKL